MGNRLLRTRLLALSCAAFGIGLLPAMAVAQTAMTVAPLVEGTKGDGTMGAAGTRSMQSGELPASNADVAMKAAADRAYDRALASGTLSAAPAESGAATDRAAAAAKKAPIIVAGKNFAGQFDAGGTPPDTTGAIGTTRFVQMVNRRFGIYNRANNALLSSGTLNQLAGWGTGVNSFDPQVIWDASTNRFYYAMDSILSSSDNRLAFGYSKTASPTTAADWCKYSVSFGSEFPDFPKLGDSRYQFQIGVNQYTSTYIRSDVMSVSKPPAGTGCVSLTFWILRNVRDTAGNRIFSPTPANGIDATNFSYVIARSLSLPSSRLFIVPISATSATATPVVSATRIVNVPSHTIPPSARQPTFTQVLDTSDTRMTQAVLSRNPIRSGSPLSLWTQQTVANGSTSAVRVYEIKPDVASPILQFSQLITGGTAFLYNAAVSSDRRADGATLQFGGSYVVGYSYSSPSIAPRVRMASSVNGGAVGFGSVVSGTAYRDFSCPNPGNRCRWGDYSGATPDPRPATTGTGAVWLSNQYGGGNSVAQANWRTRIWQARP